jgi:hypothetical protein
MHFASSRKELRTLLRTLDGGRTVRYTTPIVMLIHVRYH